MLGRERSLCDRTITLHLSQQEKVSLPLEIHRVSVPSFTVQDMNIEAQLSQERHLATALPPL
jgi:hypothetical protein